MIIKVGKENILNEDFAFGQGISGCCNYNNTGFSYQIKPLSFNLCQKGNDDINIPKNKAYKHFLGEIVKGYCPYDQKKHKGIIKYFYYGKDGDGKMPKYVYIQDFKTQTIIPLTPDSVRTAQDNMVVCPGELDYFNKNYNKVDRDFHDFSPIGENKRFDFNKSLKESNLAFSLDSYSDDENCYIAKKGFSTESNKFETELKLSLINANIFKKLLTKYEIPNSVLSSFKFSRDNDNFPALCKLTSNYMYNMSYNNAFERGGWIAVDSIVLTYFNSKYETPDNILKDDQVFPIKTFNSEITQEKFNETLSKEKYGKYIEVCVKDSIFQENAKYNRVWVREMAFTPDLKYYFILLNGWGNNADRFANTYYFRFGINKVLFDKNSNEFNISVDKERKDFNSFKKYVTAQINEFRNEKLEKLVINNLFQSDYIFDKIALSTKWKGAVTNYDFKEILKEYNAFRAPKGALERQLSKLLYALYYETFEIVLDRNLENKLNTDDKDIKAVRTSLHGDFLILCYTKYYDFTRYIELYIVDNRDFSVLSKEEIDEKRYISNKSF